MNRSYFFKRVRESLFSGKLSAKQAEGLTKILDYRDQKWPGMSNDELAYLLATAKWETAHTMQPVREMGGEAYLRSKKYYPWVGEGLVQVTWEANHRKFGATHPGQLLTWEKALPAIFEGMIKGMFTGKKLADYIGEGRRDYVGARRIVNGTDKAKQIALIAEGFREALVQANERPADAGVAKDEPQVTGKPVLKSKTVLVEMAKWIFPSGLAGFGWLADIPWQNIIAFAILILACLSAWSVYLRWQKSVNEGI